MSAPRRRGGPPDLTPYLAPARLGFVVIAAGSVWVACSLRHTLAGDPAPTSANPITFLIQLVTGQADRPGTTTFALLAAEAAILILAVPAGSIWWRRRRGGKRTRVDAAARHMADRRDLQ